MNIKLKRNKVLMVVLMCAILLSSISVWWVLNGSELLDNIILGDEPQAQLVTVRTSDSDVKKMFKGWQHAVVAANGAVIRTDPGVRAATIDVLEGGTEIIAIEQYGEWLRIRCGVQLGWLKKKDVELLDSSGMTEYAPRLEQIEKVGKSDSVKLDKIAQKYKCMGVTIAVIEDGEVRYTYEYGWANEKEQKEMTEDTKVRVASLTKVVLGMSALSLRDMGWLSLDEDISVYLDAKISNPRYPNTPITLRHMLTHTSTLIENTSYRSPRSFLMSRNSYRTGKPGDASMWSYSNIASGCAGATIEYAIDMTLVDFVEGYYFDAMGVDASYLPERIDNIDQIATLYSGKYVAQSVDDQMNRFYTETPGGNSRIYYGSLVISAKDYARLLCILMGDGSYKGISYMSEDSVKEMKETHLELKDFDQCLVLRKQENIYDDRTLYYHTGNAIGVLALASFDDEADDGVVVVTTGAGASRDQYGIYSVCGELTEYCYANIIK